MGHYTKDVGSNKVGDAGWHEGDTWVENRQTGRKNDVSERKRERERGGGRAKIRSPTISFYLGL